MPTSAISRAKNANTSPAVLTAARAYPSSAASTNGYGYQPVAAPWITVQTR